MNDNSPDYSKVLISLKRKFFRYRNGQVVDLMQQAGCHHTMSYGLNHQNILNIARSMEKDHLLAEHLFRKEIREFQLISFLLEDFEKQSLTSIITKIESVNHSEYIEFSVRYVYANHPEAWNLCQLLVQSKHYYARMAGNLLLARLSQISRELFLPDFDFEVSLRLQIQQCISFDRPLALALAAWSTLSKDYTPQVMKIIDELRTRNERHLLLMAEEISTRMSFE
jgi:hypothetical protein